MRNEVAILLLLASIACERSYGVNRIALLTSAPQRECVTGVLKSIDEITSVEEDHSKSFQRYRYSGEGFWAYASFGPGTDEGTILFLNERISVNKRPPVEEVTMTRRMMRVVESRLAAECNLPELLTSVREECIEVDCDSE